jgi:homoaconitase/3-isopropylmalate dehydratase large subunit
MEKLMRAITKFTTGVAATALVFTGLLGAVGVASASEAPSGNVTVPSLGSVTVTGTVVKVEGKQITVLVDGSNRKVVVAWDALTKVVGDIKNGVKVRVVTFTVEDLLSIVKAQGITVLS